MSRGKADDRFKACRAPVRRPTNSRFEIQPCTQMLSVPLLSLNYMLSRGSDLRCSRPGGEYQGQKTRQTHPIKHCRTSESVFKVTWHWSRRGNALGREFVPQWWVISIASRSNTSSVAAPAGSMFSDDSAVDELQAASRTHGQSRLPVSGHSLKLRAMLHVTRSFKSLYHRGLTLAFLRNSFS